jgi:hypothetical protein
METKYKYNRKLQPRNGNKYARARDEMLRKDSNKPIEISTERTCRATEQNWTLRSFIIALHQILLE